MNTANGISKSVKSKKYKTKHKVCGTGQFIKSNKPQMVDY